MSFEKLWADYETFCIQVEGFFPKNSNERKLLEKANVLMADPKLLELNKTFYNALIEKGLKINSIGDLNHTIRILAAHPDVTEKTITWIEGQCLDTLPFDELEYAVILYSAIGKVIGADLVMDTDLLSKVLVLATEETKTT